MVIIRVLQVPVSTPGEFLIAVVFQLGGVVLCSPSVSVEDSSLAAAVCALVDLSGNLSDNFLWERADGGFAQPP